MEINKRKTSQEIEQLINNVRYGLKNRSLFELMILESEVGIEIKERATTLKRKVIVSV